MCKAALLAVTTPWSVAAVLAADRTGKGLRTAPRDALISLSVPPEMQGRAFGVHRALDTAGALLGPPLAFGVLWVAVDGYAAVFTVSACVAVLGVVMLALFVREAPAPAAPRARAQPPVRSLLRIAGLRRMCLTAAVLGLFTVGDAFLYLLLQRRLDLPAAYFPLLPVGTAAVFLLAAVPVGGSPTGWGAAGSSSAGTRPCSAPACCSWPRCRPGPCWSWACRRCSACSTRPPTGC